nr:hypothetical protein CFP56_66026 [Quercus suber]
MELSSDAPPSQTAPTAQTKPVAHAVSTATPTNAEDEVEALEDEFHDLVIHQAAAAGGGSSSSSSSKGIPISLDD